MHTSSRVGRRRWPADVLGAAALLAVGQVEIWTGERFGGIGQVASPPRLAEAVLVVVITGSLAARRRWTLPVAGAVLAGLAVQVLAVAPQVSLLAGLLPLLVCVYSAAAYAPPPASVAPLLGALGVQAIFSARIAEERATGEVLFGVFVILGAWLVGDVARGRLHRTKRATDELATIRAEHDAWTAQAIAHERAAIARELHDVIAHGVSVMGVQAAGARILVDRDPDQAKAALHGIETQARESVGELQRLLGVLRESNDDAGREPRPGLAQVAALIEHMRQAGLPADLDIVGVPRPLPAGLDLAAYRIAQEALTNVLKHAGTVPTHVRIGYDSAAMTLEVRDEGPVRVESRAPGHGLLGMRERVALYDGSLEVGGCAGGGFHVAARIPLPLERR